MAKRVEEENGSLSLPLASLERKAQIKNKTPQVQVTNILALFVGNILKLYIIFFLHAPLSWRYGDVLTFPANIPGHPNRSDKLIPWFQDNFVKQPCDRIYLEQSLLVCWHMWHAEMNSLSGM